jgi:hypothetical protein
VRVTAMLCNHAEAQNNLLYISGAGIDRAIVPPGTAGPWPISVAIGLLVAVPWTSTNQQHIVRITLIDADGHSVRVPTGPDSEDDLKAEAAFNVGRPPELGIGEDQTVSLAVNMPMLPMNALGQYKFIIELDGSAEVELPYRLTTPPGMTVGIGPTSMPGTA